MNTITRSEVDSLIVELGYGLIQYIHTLEFVFKGRGDERLKEGRGYIYSLNRVYFFPTCLTGFLVLLGKGM